MYTLPTLTSAEHISSTEKATIDAAVTRCLEIHRQNRRIITQLTLESVAALTASEARTKTLQRQGFFQRLWRHLTGKTLDVQTQISFELAQAQYASQQILQQLAEQHVLTFDVVTAVNNKLNTLTLELDEELNRVYETLKAFFSAMQTELTNIQQQLDHLERNVTLLHWSHTIKYQRYHGVEYADLAEMEKIVCVINDFFQHTQGSWSTSDLMVLKATLAELGVAVKGTLTAREFFQTLVTHPDLIERVFLEIPVMELEQLEMFDAPLLKGIEKLQRLDNEEAYLVESLLTILQTKGEEVSRKDMQLSLLEHYLRQYADLRVEQEVVLFDVVVELLVGLRMILDLHQHVQESEALPVEVEIPQEIALAANGEQNELDRRMLGHWRCEWYLPRLNYYSGYLVVSHKSGDECYAGKFFFRYGSQKPQQEIVTAMLKVTVQQETPSEYLSEEASIVVQGDSVAITCSNPSQVSWNPDIFELTLDRYSGVMTGISKHVRGFRGKITFTKQESM